MHFWRLKCNFYVFYAFFEAKMRVFEAFLRCKKGDFGCFDVKKVPGIV